VTTYQRKHYGRLPEPEGGELRALWRERLEHLWRSNTKDVAEQRPGAVVAAVRVAAEAIRLDGLAAPDRLTVGVAPTEDELAAFVTAVLDARRGYALPEEANIFGDDIQDAEVIETREPNPDRQR
jgi:hypothetical protein